MRSLVSKFFGLSLCVLSPFLATAADFTYEDVPFTDNAGLDVDGIEQAPNFWQIKARYDISANASINSSPYQDDDLQYGEGEASGTYVYWLSPESLLSFGAGWGNTYVNWKENPFFNKKSYNNVYATIGGLTNIDDWSYQAEFSVNTDTDRFFNQSTLYSFGGWGRYSYAPCWGPSIGLIVRSGIRQDRIWPIFGFDVQLDKWSINVVYPTNLSVIYRFAECWSTGLAVRIINNRHRLEKDEPLANGIFEYRNAGLEACVNYECAPFFAANLHIGVLGEGNLKVSNSQDNNPTYVRTDATGYAGGSVQIRF